MKSEKQEVVVGIFVFCGMCAFIFSFLFLSSDKLFSYKKTELHTIASDAEGLLEGAKVVFSGLQVGTVKKIDLDPSSKKIKISFQVEKKVVNILDNQSLVEIATLGVLGDKYLNILPGESDQMLVSDYIPYKKNNPFNKILTQGTDLMETLTHIAAQLETILKTFNKGHRSERLFESLELSLKNFATLTRLLAQKVEALNLNDSIERLNNILDKIDHGSGTMSLLINDPLLYDQIKELIGGVNRNRIIRNVIRESLNSHKP